MRTRHHERGFTMVEVVIALLGIVVALLLAAWLIAPVFARYQSARQAAAPSRPAGVLATAVPSAPYGTRPLWWANGTVFIPCRGMDCGPALDAFLGAYRHCDIRYLDAMVVNGQTEGYYLIVRPRTP